MFESIEQRICDRARNNRKNGWLSEAELKTIKKRVSEDYIAAKKNEAEVYNELGERN